VEPSAHDNAVVGPACLGEGIPHSVDDQGDVEELVEHRDDHGYTGKLVWGRQGPGAFRWEHDGEDLEAWGWCRPLRDFLGLLV